MLKPSEILSIFIWKNRMCRMIEMSGFCDSPDFDDNTILVGTDNIG